MIEIYLVSNRDEVSEGAALSVTAYFREGDAATAPTTSQYRIDCLTTGKVIRDWTDLTPAASNAITVQGAENNIQNQSNRYERKQITVQSDQGTTSRFRQSLTWKVKNLGGIS